ncbi:MAG: OmpA family protein [Syntrophales bacterium]|nr:OmpA family protein [Syntrophales bacterium]
MRREKNPAPEVRPSSWLVSFNDLLTLLLTFFILLVSLSSVQSTYLKAAAESLAQTFERVGTEGAFKDAKKGTLEKIKGLNVREEKNSLRFALNESSLFEKGSAELRPSAHEALRQLAEIVKSEGIMIRVEGHTDNVPIKTERFPSNWELSVARADSIVKFMAELGVPAQKLSVAGYADSRPIAPNNTESGRAMNRRTEIVMIWQEEKWQEKTK